MTVSTYNPADHANHQHTHGNHDRDHHSHSHSHAPMGRGDDILRVMPTLNDLQKPHSDQEFIQKAMAEERSNHKSLIASSRDELPSVTVNGVMIDRTAIAQELQYHPAPNKEDAVFLATQALVVRELLRLAVLDEPSLGEAAWLDDEEKAVSDLIEKNVQATMPDIATCERY